MKKIISIALLTLVLSCSNDDDEIQINTVIQCLGTVEVPFGLPPCSDFPPNESICETISIGDFELEDSSKEYMVHACKNLGDNLEYFNEKGEKIVFGILGKEYQKTISIYPGAKCQMDSTKLEGICLLSEFIRLTIKSNSPELELVIEIKTIPNANEDGSMGVGDFLQISKRIGPNSVLTGLFAVISQRTLDYEESIVQENLGTLEILGEEFDQVISNVTSTGLKYYFNNSHGLIGFIDETGVVWKIK